MVSINLVKNVLPERNVTKAEAIGSYIYFDNDFDRFNGRYIPKGEKDYKINIYEFAFRCKEWASSNGYSIQSETGEYSFLQEGRRVLYRGFAGINCGEDEAGHCDCEEGFYATSEVQAIFKACEWILKQIQK